MAPYKKTSFTGSTKTAKGTVGFRDISLDHGVYLLFYSAANK
jgi:hypothetical protein